MIIFSQTMFACQVLNKVISSLQVDVPSSSNVTIDFGLIGIYMLFLLKILVGGNFDANPGQGERT